MALAHKVGTDVENRYRRTDLFDRRRALAERWARYCDGDDGGAEIIDLAGARSA